jgi:drug/metabolite transporter (DMT)-like permease
MIGFASNSLLCRAALKQTNIDAASFTLVRIVSGAAMLWLIAKVRRSGAKNAGNWPSALALVIYAAAFSFAYKNLTAGSGALLLFGAVQATMILWGFRQGEHLDAIQIVGLVVALAGLVTLLVPGLTTPPLIDSILMLSAGVAWGVYSLRGKGASDAIGATSGNFARAVPFALLISLFSVWQLHLNSLGLGYAAISGAITSGLGYVIWYQVLPSLKAISAATVQLSVPVLTATGGILLLSEPITLRYTFATIAVLGGIALVIVERNRSVATKK